MAKNIFVTFLALLSFQIGHATKKNVCVFNAEVKEVKDSSRFQEVYINTLKEMTPSLLGRTAQGNNYILFAIKKSRGWNFLILDSSGYYSLKQEKVKKKDIGSKDEVTENSETYTDMLCMMAKAKLLKKTTKPKNVSGLTFTCYYKFRPQARKMYRSLIRVQNRVQFFDGNLKNGPKGKKTILNDLIK